MSPTRWSPLHIKIILHAYTSPSPMPNAHADAVCNYTQQLLAADLIEQLDEVDCYQATSRGRAFVEMLCTTDLPVLNWCTPSGEIIAAHEASTPNPP